MIHLKKIALASVINIAYELHPGDCKYSYDFIDEYHGFA